MRTLETMLNVVDVLSQCELFSAVPPRSFQRLAAMAQLRKFRRGELIFRQQADCPGVFVVGKGTVRVFKLGPGGKEHVLHMVEPGGTFAEIAAIGGFAVPAAAEAIEPAVCVLLPQTQFRKALAEDHQLCLGMMAGLARWVRHLVGLLEDVVLRDAVGRIARYLIEARRGADGSVALPSLKRHVASHLNLTSETFSRTLRRLTDAGLIAAVGKNRIKIVDETKLLRVAAGLALKE
jgi:CRP/FNR family transcriptional regulator, dissimilatory nitrate respiration regulator